MNESMVGPIALTLVLLILFTAMWRVGYEMGRNAKDEARHALAPAPVSNEAANATAEAAITAFAVAGRPRKPTWRQRRRELEAQSRKERERIEQWRG